MWPSLIPMQAPTQHSIAYAWKFSGEKNNKEQEWVCMTSKLCDATSLSF